MKPLTHYTTDYFKKFSTAPVTIKPFDPKTRLVAREYMRQLSRALEPWNVQPKLIGSTAYGIAGKGEIEIGLFLNDKNWNDVIEKLESTFSPMEIREKDYARFNDKLDNYEIEVVLLKGYTAKVNKKIHDFFLNHPEILKKYEGVKQRFSYSKRDYQIHKTEFLNDIIKDLPEK